MMENTIYNSSIGHLQQSITNPHSFIFSSTAKTVTLLFNLHYLIHILLIWLIAILY